MRLNVNIYLVFLLSLSIVAGYSYYSYSHGISESALEYANETSGQKVDNASQAAKAVENPRVTIVGNPNKLPQDVKAKLPTGYGWQEKDAPRPLEFDSGDENDPVAVFLIDPHNPKFDMSKQMEFAIEKGKQEVYFIIDELNPNLEYGATTPEDLLAVKLNNSSEEGDFNPLSINNIIFDFLTPPAYAHSVQGTFCGGPTYPAGICSSWSFTDDDPNDGQTPSFLFCAEYEVAICFFDSVYEHSRKNFAVAPTVTCNHTSSNSSPCPFKDCMNAENSNNNVTFKAPVNLTVRLFNDVQELREWGIATQGQDGQGGCGTNPPSNLCGCAGRPDLSNPRRSIDGSINFAGRNSCSWVELIRHELAHTYGYTHSDFSNNLDSSKHCKNQHINH